jgi:hypothetical protein
MLTHERIVELFDYDAEAGELVCRVHRGPRARAGQHLRTLNKQGRVLVQIDGKRYYVHRLIWFYFYRQWPAELDHIDRNPKNNRIENLRSATRQQNIANTSLIKSTTSGRKGVQRHRSTGKWIVRIGYGYKRLYLGLFSDLERAQQAYVDKAKELFGEFACP